MKVALVYDRVNKWGGAERDLLILHELFPDAPLYTSVYSPKGAPWARVFPKVIPSFLNRIPLITEKHQYLGTLMPLAFESFDFSNFDLVISVTSEAAKGIIVRPPTKHICYCLTPTRYLWSGYKQYFKDSTHKAAARPVVWYLRKWDRIAALRPDVMVAISSAVKYRIKRYYGRDSVVIHPPVEVDLFKNSKSSRIRQSLGWQVKSRTNQNIKENFFLVVGRLVPYKRIDLAIQAFNLLGKHLVVVGVGSEERRLKKLAKQNIEFIGRLTDQELSHYYREARALIVPQEEDFGKVVVEAQIAGTPVIAYEAGGAIDTVISGVNGIFFEKQTINSLIAAVRSFEKLKFDTKKVCKSAERFTKDKFKKDFLKLLK